MINVYVSLVIASLAGVATGLILSKIIKLLSKRNTGVEGQTLYWYYPEKHERVLDDNQQASARMYGEESE